MNNHINQIDTFFDRLSFLNNKNILVISDFMKILTINEFRYSDKILSYFFEKFIDLIRKDGNLIVPTGNINMVNSQLIYDIDKTKSWKFGSFSEKVRTSNNSFRTKNPIISYAIIGKNARDLEKLKNKNCYGYKSPNEWFVENNVYVLNLGIHPKNGCSTIHHTEYLVNVPYRFVKKFQIKIKNQNKIYKKNFYLNVRYKCSSIQKNGNDKLFADFSKKEKFMKFKCLNNFCYIYEANKLFYFLKNKLVDNPYYLLKQRPQIQYE